MRRNNNNNKEEIEKVFDYDGSVCNKPDGVPSLGGNFNLDSLTEEDSLESYFQVQEGNKKELLNQLKNAMNTLTPREREALELTYFQQLKQQTVCERMQTSQPRVSKLVNKALEKVKHFIKGNYE